MNSKYELTQDTKDYFGITLYRIRALVAIAEGVAAGDIGGYIEQESNLQVSGNAWVYDNAWVYGNARVSGNAQVSDNARVYDNAQVYGNARVSGNAQVSDNAQVDRQAQVSGNAWVSDNAWVSGNARVSPIMVVGLKWHVTIMDSTMQIGCQFHTLQAWADFDDAEIVAMGGSNALRFWRENKAWLLARRPAA